MNLLIIVSLFAVALWMTSRFIDSKFGIVNIEFSKTSLEQSASSKLIILIIDRNRIIKYSSLIFIWTSMSLYLVTEKLGNEIIGWILIGCTIFGLVVYMFSQVIPVAVADCYKPNVVAKKRRKPR